MDFDYKFAWNADDGMGSIDFMSYKVSNQKSQFVRVDLNCK